LQRVGDKAAHGVRVAEHAVGSLDFARHLVGLDAALGKEPALPLLPLCRLVPCSMQSADIGRRQRQFELLLARDPAQQHVIDDGLDDAFRIDRHRYRDAEAAAVVDRCCLMPRGRSKTPLPIVLLENPGVPPPGFSFRADPA
jgi:hypothetical protein